MKDLRKINRRKFLGIAAGSIVADGMASAVGPLEARGETVPEPAKMPVRPLGNTGVQVGLLSLGGQGFFEQPGTTPAPRFSNARKVTD